MRNAFADEITRLVGENPRIVLLTGDIGNRLFDKYKIFAPARFFNCGVAEQNMITMSAGMAMAGLRPVVYTIAPFLTVRCLEQIKLDVCYHKLPVTIVGTGAGLSYANLGPTHHSLEDIAILRAIPEMAIVCPADTMEVRLGLRAALDYAGPVYLRIGKKNEPVVHKTIPDFKIGKAIVLREGKKVCLLATGNVLPIAIAVADLIAADGISCRIVSCHTVKPIDEECLASAADCPVVVTLEEHSIVGGLGSAVAEWMADRHSSCGHFIRCGTPDNFLHEAGGQKLARANVGLTAENIAARIRLAMSL